MPHADDEGFLDRAYAVEDPAATKELYADWAASYDAELRANGYVTPKRCAAALASQADDPGGALLDIGCGTGLSGAAFRDAGFEVIDGTDFSPEMLAEARRKRGVYRDLVLGDLNRPIPAAPGEYAYMAAVGVFSPGHAPASLIERVVTLLPPAGCFVFSLNDHALEDPSYEASIRSLTDDGMAELAFREYGEHVPGLNLRADVCVLRRA